MVEDQRKSWYKIGNSMGLIVVLLEEQQTEEDKEVQRIYEKGKETKRKISPSMLIMSDEFIILVHVLIILIEINVELVELNVFTVHFVVAVRKVAAGHKMILDGHKTVAEGWRMFEEAVDESMPGDLPQFLWQLKGKMMLMPPPLPMDLEQASQHSPVPSPVKREGNKSEESILVMILGHKNWACPQCNTVRGSCNGCDAHIRHILQLFYLQYGFAAKT